MYDKSVFEKITLKHYIEGCKNYFYLNVNIESSNNIIGFPYFRKLVEDAISDNCDSEICVCGRYWMVKIEDKECVDKIYSTLSDICNKFSINGFISNCNENINKNMIENFDNEINILDSKQKIPIEVNELINNLVLKSKLHSKELDKSLGSLESIIKWLDYVGFGGYVNKTHRLIVNKWKEINKG